MESVRFFITSDLLATRTQRLLNCIIDLSVIYIFGISAATTIVIIGQMTNNHTMADWVEHMGRPTKMVLWVVIMLLYYSLTEFYLSRTVAKYLTKTVLVMEDGSRPDMNTIMKRTMCRLIPIDPFTFFNKDARGWHDSFSHTYVVKKHKFNSRRGHVPFYG